MQEKTIQVVTQAIITLGLAGLGVLAYYLGGHDIGAALVGGALGQHVAGAISQARHAEARPS
jgi:hypothetical protein